MMLFLLFFSILCSCSSEPKVREYRAPKTGAQFWDVPVSWNMIPSDGIRSASFIVHGDEGKSIDISVVYLEGGGSQLDNINRWRNEIGLPPWSEDEVEIDITDLSETEVRSVDLIGRNERIFVSFFPYKKGIWFFKMKGDISLIDEEKDHLYPFVQSFKETQSI